MTPQQEAAIFGKQRNGLINLERRWPNNIVPYTLVAEINDAHRTLIEKSLRLIEDISCIRFIVRTDEVDYVEVMVRRI